MHIQPNYFVSEVGKHADLPVERLQLSSDGNILASCSHDNVIKFWNISDVYNQQPITERKMKTKKRKNEISTAEAKDFFSDLWEGLSGTYYIDRASPG